MSFEELQAFFDAREVELAKLEDCPVDEASYYGRIFAKSGGITQGVVNVAKSMGLENVKPVAMNGIEECRINLLKLKLGRAAENFFEGMACDGGCLTPPRTEKRRRDRQVRQCGEPQGYILERKEIRGKFEERSELTVEQLSNNIKGSV